MTKIFIYSLLFINLGYSQNLMPYVSPGIQIGINNNKKFNFSYQISIGLASTEDPFFSTGISFGKRKYRIKSKNWKSFKYHDFQIYIPYLLTGIGLGKIYNASNNQYRKIKIFSGILFFGEYNYINLKNNIKIENNLGISKHNFGIFGIFPFTDYQEFL